VRALDALVAASLFLVLSGCAGRSDALRARFARDTSCEESRVSVSPDGNTHFTARGCDRSITYVCQDAMGSSADTCGEVRDQPGADGPPPARTNVPGTDPSLPNP